MRKLTQPSIDTYNRPVYLPFCLLSPIGLNFPYSSERRKSKSHNMSMREGTFLFSTSYLFESLEDASGILHHEKLNIYLHLPHNLLRLYQNVSSS